MARASTDCVLLTKSSPSENATRCRNWSGPVSSACQNSDSKQGVGVFAHCVGSGFGSVASVVCGTANCA